uniref:Intronic ORF n=1 Tax=Nitella hyalina TaxID=181804 RepID=H9LSH4_NITHY|nr:intronic ORF [Nitella hyalina]AEH42864.1 intronic ORF [Nitella hyalina]
MERVVNSLKNIKGHCQLTPELSDISIGLLLGDVSLQTQNNGKTYRIKFEYGNKNFEYAKHLYEKLAPWILSPPRAQDRVNTNGVTVRTWCFQTISHSAFLPLASIFLDQNRKKHIIPCLVEDYLTAQGLAYWYMDDGGRADYGNRTQKGMSLHTHGFKEHEVVLLCDGLKKKFDLQCWPKRNKKKFMIVISGHSYETVISLIGNSLIPSMKHKLPLPRKLR